MEASQFPPEAVVVRGAKLKNREVLLRSATRPFKETGRYSLSVLCIPGLTGPETAKAAGTKQLPQEFMRCATIAALAEAGYEVLPDVPPSSRGHASLMLPTPPTDDDWDKLDQIFDDPVPNPVASDA